MDSSDELSEDARVHRPWSFNFGDGIEGLLAHDPVDHVITDPPYAREVQDGHEAIRVRDNKFKFDAITEEERNRAARAIGMKCLRWALVFCSIEEAHRWRFALEAAGMSPFRTGLWIRIGSAPQMAGDGPGQGAEAIVIAHSRLLTRRWNGGGKAANWHHPIVRSNRQHPTQKPTTLMSELVSDFTDEGEIIADPYSGVATTGVAAIGIGRRFVGWEIDKDHYQNGIKNLDLPLFDRSSKQIEIGSVTPKGARARARMELERRVLDLLSVSGSEGVQLPRLAELAEGTPREVESTLKRLAKVGAARREGKTSSVRWYAVFDDERTEIQSEPITEVVAEAAPQESP